MFALGEAGRGSSLLALNSVLAGLPSLQRQLIHKQQR